jgi:hypothetical protein
MWSGAMTYEQIFIKFGSDFQKLLAGDTHTDVQTHRHQGGPISLLLFLKNKGREE